MALSQGLEQPLRRSEIWDPRLDGYACTCTQKALQELSTTTVMPLEWGGINITHRTRRQCGVP